MDFFIEIISDPLGVALFLWVAVILIGWWKDEGY